MDSLEIRYKIGALCSIGRNSLQIRGRLQCPNTCSKPRTRSKASTVY